MTLGSTIACLRHTIAATLDNAILVPFQQSRDRCRDFGSASTLRRFIDCSRQLYSMASLLKSAKEHRAKGKGKRTAEEEDEIENNGAVQQVKRRKDKVLLLSSRGVTQRMRHLMADLEALLPHVKKGV